MTVSKRQSKSKTNLSALPPMNFVAHSLFSKALPKRSSYKLRVAMDQYWQSGKWSQLQSIDQATLRIEELTEDLLDVTRLQAGRLEFLTEPTDLVALVQRVLKQSQDTTDKHTLSLHITQEHCVFPIDTRRTEQVLVESLE